MKKITTLIIALIAVFSTQAQVVNVCGTDSIVLQVENYDGKGVIEWQESIDSVNWVTIPEFVGETYKFFPTESKYYRAVVKTSDCQPLYSAITLVQIPPIANAGIDRSIGTSSMSLLANYIPGAVGEWTILSGNGGNLENRSYHKSVLTGVNNETYKLKWTLTNACGQSSDTVQISFNQLDVINNFIVVDNTDTIFSDSTMLANGLYRIKFSDPNISPVDSVILIGMRQDISFLRKVISFTLQDSVYTFITEQGSLQDLFKSGVVNIGDAVNKSLTSASSMSKIKGVDAFPTRQTLLANKNSNDIQMLYVSSSNNKGIQMVKGSNSDIDESPFVLKMDDQTLLKNEDESFKFSIKNAYIKVTPRFLLDFKYDFPFSVSDIRIGVDNAEFEFNLGTEMVCSAAVNFSPPIKKLPIIDHHLVFAIGVIPVDVLVKFDISATSNFYTGGAIKYEQNKNIIQNLTAIATEDRDNKYDLVLKTPVPIIKNTETFSTKAEINANVKIGPKISFLLYGIAGPSLDFYAKFNASGCINSNLNWDVNAFVGFESNLGLQGDIIIKKTFVTPELRLKLFNYTYPLFDNAYKYSIKFPYKLEYLSGNFQKGKSGAELSNPVKLKVVNDWGFVVPFVPVRFATETGNGTVSHPVIFTDANGEVSNYWTLGSNAENKLKVSVQDCNDQDIEDSPVYMYASNSVPTYECSNSSLSIVMKTVNGYMYPSATGGIKPYTYSVNNVDFRSAIPQFNTLIPRKCVVYVKDQNGCIRSRTFEIKSVNTCATNNLVLTVLSQPNVLTASATGGKSPYLFKVDNISDYSTKYIYTNLTPGIHTVYVMDANGCTASRSITIDANTQAAIKAVYPQNGAAYIPLTGINFNWAAATYATNQLYDLYLKKGTDAYTLIASNLSTPSFSYSTSLLANTAYTWKIDVKGSNGTVIDFSEFTFTTASGVATEPTAPILLEPNNGYITPGLTATLRWTSQTGDFKYDVYMDTKDASTLVALNVTNTEYIVNNLVSGKIYFWKIKIKSTITGVSFMSSVWRFVVEKSNSGLTYNVTVPSGTNACYIAGTMNDWSTSLHLMDKIDATHYTKYIPTALISDQYKYCSGPGWGFQEKDYYGNDVSNRSYQIEDVVSNWALVYSPNLIARDFVYKVTVPLGTNSCYISGGMTNWSFVKMTQINSTTYTITINSIPGFTYKYASGPDWMYEELQSDGFTKVPDRTWSLNDVVLYWAAIYSNNP